MGMVVNHNLPAINANRQLGINNKLLSKSIEKLSSGMQINRAADNAAGLAISEKMRGQINGLEQASKNAQDGISLIQTAEGALNETHDILQRMRTLAVQSANGTYQDEVDREAIQLEVDALKSEIDRISTSTHYNGIQLLDGSQSGGVTSKIDFAAGSQLKLGTTVAATGKTSSLAVSADGATPDTVPIAKGDSITDIKYSLTYKDKETGATQTLTFNLGKIDSAAAAYATGADAYNAITALGSNANDTDFIGLADQLKNSSLGDDFTFAIATGKIDATARVEGSNKFEMLSGELTYTVNGKTGVAKSGASTTAKDAAEMYTVALNEKASSATDGNTKFSIDGQNFEIVKLGNTASDGYTAIYTSDGVGKGNAAANCSSA